MSLADIVQLPDSSLAAAQMAAEPSAVHRWKPGLRAPLHNEIFATGGEGSGAAFALALACDAMAQADRAREGQARALSPSTDTRSILWVQDRAALRLAGRPCRAGLPTDLRHRLIHVETKTPEDALFALEEGLKCRDLAFVLGEVAGNPRTLDFTASRRLSLTAEKHGIPLWLVRLDAAADLSSARMRWRVTAAPSTAPRWNPSAPGAPTWRAELFRARSHPPGEWTLRDDKGRLAAARPSVIPHVAANTDMRETREHPPHIGNLARPTVGRSLAAL